MSDAESILSYTLLEDKWSRLPYTANYVCFSLAIVRDKLTTVGGTTDLNNPDAATNALLSLTSASFTKKTKWKAALPPMPTKRFSAAVVTTDNHLVVAGGERGNAKLTEVEIMKTDTLEWFRVSSLPQPLSHPQMTICNRLFFVGSAECTIFSCSVDTLLTMTQSASTSIPSSSVWRRRADMPVRSTSGLVTVGGELFSIGGKDSADTKAVAIKKFNPVNETWISAGWMPTTQPQILTVVLPNGELLVVGGVYQLTNISVMKVKITKQNTLTQHSYCL